MVDMFANYCTFSGIVDIKQSSSYLLMMSIINFGKYLQNVKFNQLTLQEKLAVKQVGRPTPNFQISQSANHGDKQYTRQFNVNVYQHCGCEHSKCIIFFSKSFVWI